MTTRILCAAGVAVTLAFSAAALSGEQRSSPASCREAINGLISLLDSGKDDTALYRDTYGIVVNTCGPASRSEKASQLPRSRAACDDLAAAMVDRIEDEKMDTPAFADARHAFARACAPRRSGRAAR